MQPATADTAATGAADLRGAVRPILKFVFDRPGRVYQPIYLGPLASREILEPDIQGLSAMKGVPAYFGLGGDASRALGTRAPAVLLLGAGEAERLLEERDPEAITRQQVVVWGEEPIEEAAYRVREWVRSGGVALDPSDYVRPGTDTGFMGPTLARSATEPGTLYNPVMLLGDRPQLPYVADEAMLRLEAAGFDRVLTFAGAPDPDEASLEGAGEGDALILRMASGLPEDEAERDQLLAVVTRLVEDRVQLVFVAPPPFQEAIAEAGDAWRDVAEGGITVMAAIDPAPAPEPTPVGGDDWPPAADVLIDPPATGTARSADMAGLLSRIPLGDVLQTVVPGRKSGRVTVFGPAHLGAIDFDQGRIIHASTLADPWSAERLLAARGLEDASEAEREAVATELATDRICRIGAWEDAHFAVLFGATAQPPDSERVAMDVAGAALEIARRSDELPRLRRRVGTLARVWSRSGELESARKGSSLARLWHAIDGERTLEAAARVAGVLDFDALDTAFALQAEGRLEPVGEGTLRRRQPAAHHIAHTLLAWGLRAEAQTVLADAEEAELLTPRGAFLLGHLVANASPERAARAFGAASRAASVADAAHLNAGLLAVRTRHRDPGQVWADARARIEGLESPGPRVRAVACELACRAGDGAAARAALKALRRAQDGALDAVVRTLAEAVPSR